MSVKGQVHSKFKLFSGPLGPNASLGALAGQVESFAASVKAAPKSIGVEYLEASKQVVLSLGYRLDEDTYPIKLHTISLGKVASIAAADLATLEEKMEEAADKIPHVICHELLVTETNEFVMVLMTHAG